MTETEKMTKVERKALKVRQAQAEYSTHNNPIPVPEIHLCSEVQNSHHCELHQMDSAATSYMLAFLKQALQAGCKKV